VRGSGGNNPQAKRGYSRDNRPDCVQVCIGIVVSCEGLPLSFEIFDGNRTDVTTVEEMVEIMEKKYGQAEGGMGNGGGMERRPEH
jgi:transposase